MKYHPKNKAMDLKVKTEIACISAQLALSSGIHVGSRRTGFKRR